MVAPKTPYSSPTLTAGTYQSVSLDLTIEAAPTTQGRFWAFQFGFSGGNGGYFGLQTLGTGLPGKCVVFSIADAISGTGTGIVTNEFDGAPGVSTRKTYEWVIGRTYRFAMTRGTDDGTGRLWSVDVTDLTTSTTTAVATIKVPLAWGALTNAPILWSEHYTSAPTCGDIGYSAIRWENLSQTPLGGGSAATPSAWTNTYATSPCTEAASTVIAAGVRQELGATAIASGTPTLTAELFDASNSSRVAVLSESFDRRFQDPVSELGSGTLTLLADDANASALTIGRHVRFLIDGDPVFTFRIDKREARPVDRGEESAQVVVASGRGVGVAFTDAVVYPQGGTSFRPQSEVRPFTWASSYTSTAGWPNAVGQFDNACIPTIYDPVTGTPPLGWPAPVTSSKVRWIWSRGRAAHPAGISLFRKSFTLGSSTQCVMFLAGTARCYLDAIELIPYTATFPNWGHNYTTARMLVISAGTHELAIEARNDDFTGLYQNPSQLGCVLGALHSVPTSGSYGEFNSLIVGTDDTWKCLDYPASYPNPSPGTILSTLVTEAQARGALSGWSFGGAFSATTDSNGVPWASSLEVSPRVGDSVLAVLKQMTELQLIDWRADAVGRVLRVWNWGTSVADTAVTITPGVNALEITHTSEAV